VVREGDIEAPRADAVGRLTDRQRAAFEAAYYGGYFEWPRDSTAEELANAMDVSAPTFHQHLRAAERKLLGEFAE
ncbi:helix-turn-helix domain-containing protein, partial [Halarchaeum acidiphilum]